MGANVETHNQTIEGARGTSVEEGEKKSARARGVEDTMRALPSELAKQGS